MVHAYWMITLMCVVSSLANTLEMVEYDMDDLNNQTNGKLMPKFDQLNENVTVIIGTTAVLPCFISDIGDHKVAWIKVGTTDVIYIGDFKVTNDDRIKIQHGYFSDWSLIINQVNDEDSGEYICQVNTEPQIIKRINIKVLIPPKIIEEKSVLSPNEILEGNVLRLHCEVDGSPKPHVTWYFRHYSHGNESFHIRRFHNNSVIHEGDTIIIPNMTRDYSGLFECIANNSVPPAASRKIRVLVEFEPEVSIEKRTIETQLGLSVQIECEIKSSPLLNFYWYKDNRVIESGTQMGSPSSQMFKLMHEHNRLHSHSKYQVHNIKQNEFTTKSVLAIRNVTRHDLGTYECIGVNRHKISKAHSELKEILVATKRLSNTRVMTTSSLENSHEFMEAVTWKVITRKKSRNKNQTHHFDNIIRSNVNDPAETSSTVSQMNSNFFVILFESILLIIVFTFFY